mgnify:CR=1 FL=1
MADPPLNPLTGEDYLRTYLHAFHADPREYRRTLNASPLEDIMGSSQMLDYLRQRLPQNLGQTGAGKWLLDLLPESEKPKDAAARVRQVVEGFPLGGYQQSYKDEFAAQRAENPRLQIDTVQVGKIPAAGGGEVPTGENLRAAASQAAGVATADAMTDGARNLWWFLNAPQALSTLAVLQAVNQSGRDFADPDDGNFMKRGRTRLAAAVPAWIGMSMAVGNFGRQPGYTAAVPSEADPTQAADPLAEAGSRFFLGRTGSLLPYDEFVKERPDVSRSEYESYKAYLFGDRLPLKATFDGISGPEVTFMGKSIPVLTGLLPAVAAVAGASYGVRKAGRLLQGIDRSGKRAVDATGQPMVDRLAQEDALFEAAFDASRLPDDQRVTAVFTKARKLREIETALDPNKRVQEPTQELVDAYRKYRDYEQANQNEILKQALVYSSLGLTGSAVGGQTLEFIRRSLDGEDSSSNVQALQP